MNYKCSITGETLQESEGMTWKQLRPSLQEFLKTLTPNWNENSFISYKALNDLLRAYIAHVTSEEVKAHQALAEKVHKRYENEEVLKPISPNLDAGEETLGEKLADKIADFGGSWKFIIIFMAVIIIWMSSNILLLHNKGYDPYPFILLNLVLSCLAALQAPVIMMSQNRQETKDRERAEYDFKVNLKAEIEVRLLHEKLDHLLLHQHQNISEILQLQLDTIQQMQQRWDTMHYLLKTIDNTQSSEEQPSEPSSTNKPAKE